MASQALIVGIANRPGSPLPGADNDVLEWTDLVKGPPFNCSTPDILQNKAATKSEILTHLTNMIKASKPLDHLLFFFSSHGTVLLINGRPVPGLVAYSSGLPTASDVILEFEIEDAIKHLPGGVQLTLILDACNAPSSKTEREIDVGYRVKFIPIQSPTAAELEPLTRGQIRFGLARVKDLKKEEPLVLRATDEWKPAYEYTDASGKPYGLYCNKLAQFVRTTPSITHRDAADSAYIEVQARHSDQFPQINGPRQTNPFFT